MIGTSSIVPIPSSITSKRFSQPNIKPALPAFARPLFANAIIQADAQAFLHVEEVAQAAAVIGFQQVGAKAVVPNGARPGKAHHAKTVVNAVAQFGLAGGVVFIAVTAIVIAAHAAVAAHGGEQVKRCLIAQQAVIVQVVRQNKMLVEPEVLAKLNGEYAAVIAVIAKYAFYIVIAGAEQYAVSGIGIVVARIKNKAGPNGYAAAAAGVLYQRVGFKNAHVGAAKNVAVGTGIQTQVQVRGNQLFGAEVEFITLLANMFGVGLAGSIANAIKIEREVEVPKRRGIVVFVTRAPIAGADAGAVLPLGGNGAIGKHIAYAGAAVQGIGIKAVQQRAANFDTRFGRAAQYRQGDNAAALAAVLFKYNAADKLWHYFILCKQGLAEQRTDNEAVNVFLHIRYKQCANIVV
jgi:hypothetical protein